MSWSGYIDSLCAADSSGVKHVEHAAICGFEPGQEGLWASSPGFAAISVDEIKKMANDRGAFPQNGVYIAGKKGFMLNDQLNNGLTLNIKGQKQEDGSSRALCVGKSNKALVIVEGKAEVTNPKLTEIVFKMVEYLKGAGY